MIRIAVQKSGRIAEETFALFAEAGLKFPKSSRALVAQCTNFPLEVLFLREKDIPEIVADNVADLGICGENTLVEKGLDLPILEKLGFGKCRLSLAIPEGSPKDFSFEGKKIATSYPKTLKKYLEKKNIQAEIVEISGSVEIMPNLGLADGICDLVSTGSTLQKNKLVEASEILTSEVVLFGKKKFTTEEQEILDKILLRIRGVQRAKKYKYIVLNLEKSNIALLSQVLPGLKSPTISPLVKEGWVSVSTVIEEDVFWETIEKLKGIGAQGILVQPIEKIVL